VRRLALPYLLDLQASAVGDKPWTVTLMIPVDDVVTVIERIWTKSLPLDMVLDIGDTFPIDLAAAGRAILAYREPDEARQLLGSERYDAVVPALERVRSVDGVALSHGEAIPGIEAISAAVRSRRGQAVAAVALSSLSLGVEMSDESHLAAQLRRSARAIGQSLP
jgi:DNA-binding IclR family transcriptional regulator